jgi:hypothetical protein
VVRAWQPGSAHRKETEKMRRLLLISILCLTGCNNIVGPFGQRKPERVDDPLISISEQQRRARYSLALPDDSATLAPRTGVELPGPHGR